MNKLLILTGLVGLTSIGCAARSDNIYQDDVTKVLLTKADSLSACHGEALKSDPAAGGTVTLTFKVEEDSGNFSGAAVDSAATNAPEALQQCAISAVAGLTLEPGDNRPAAARYEFVFAQSGAAGAVAAPAEGGGKDLKLKTAPDPTAQ